MAARKLGYPQLAFVRCWAEGLDLVAAWNRYLYVDGPGDARRARGELQRLLDVLRALARSHGRGDMVSLLRRDPEAIIDKGPALPTLDEFADQQPPDFYSQAELLDLYQQEVGRLDSRSSRRRRQRLRERLVLAVQWLEHAGARDPQPADAVAAWLDERVAARLSAAGIRSLGDLVAWVSRKGFHWHRGVPRLGARGAARIVRWITQHQATLGALPARARIAPGRIDAAALVPAPCTGIVPLERLVLPPGCGPSVAAELMAVQDWLALRAPGTHTWRAYRKEAERFVLWVLLQRRKALAALDAGDCAAYRDFLAAPGPDWTGPRNVRRCSSDWRPFEGPLSPRSVAAALSIVRGLCAWLVQQRHLARNPWDDASGHVPVGTATPLRALDSVQWDLLQRWLALQAPSPALHRARFVLGLGYLAGLRLSELAAARAGWLHPQRLAEGGHGWALRVPGRRGPCRQVPMADAVVADLQAYLRSRGLDDDLQALPPGTPLVARLGQESPLSAGRVYEVLVSAFRRCAAALNGAEKIREASTRWLRHGHGMQAAAQGVPQPVLQARLGHRRRASTAIYGRADALRRGAAVVSGGRG